MSHVFFHSQHGEAGLTGRERGHLQLLGERAGAASVTPLGPGAAHRLASLIPPNHYLRGRWSETGWVNKLLEAMSSSVLVPLTWRGTILNSRTVVRNSAMLRGNDQVRLAVRLNAQCEIHAWVDGPNRAWLADMMQAGLDNGTYNRGQGWPEVIELLRARADEPVVASSSFEDQFPNVYVSTWRQPPMPEGWMPEGQSQAEFTRACRTDRKTAAGYWADLADEQFGELPEAAQWEHSMAALRADTESLLELRPDDWARFYFGHGISLQDLLADDYADRLDRALDGYPEDAD